MSNNFRHYQPETQLPLTCKLEEPYQYRLNNGIKVFQYNAGSQEVVRIEMIFSAGSRYQPKPFSAMAASLMVREGTSGRSAAEIASILDYYGAYLEASAEKDNAYITLFSLNKHLPHTLPVLAEIVKSASFPENEFGIMLRKQRQTLVINQEKVNYLARTRFNSLVFGEHHPYGAYVVPEQMDDLHKEDALSFYKSYYHSGNCTLFVSGKIMPGLDEMLQTYFGNNDWNGQPADQKLIRVDKPVANYRHISKQGAVQSAIRIGRQLFNRRHPDFTGMRVLNTLLGGYFGSRLMRNLREDKGYTYGVGSAVIPLKDNGIFFITCEVGASHTASAIEEIKKELANLRSQPVNEDELLLVKNFMSGSYLRSIDGPFAMADTYRSVMEDGLDSTFIQQSLQTMHGIKPEQLMELAQRYLDMDDMCCLIAGPDAFKPF